jgi:hypothetical protein
VAYIVAFMVMVVLVGWQPEPLNKNAGTQPSAVVQPAH